MNSGNLNISLTNINSVPWGTVELKPDKPVKKAVDGIRPSGCMKKALSMKQEPPIACDGEDVSSMHLQKAIAQRNIDLY